LAYCHKKEKNMEAAQILEEADIIFSDNAAKKVSDLIQEEKNNDLKLRVYITGGGCSGFSYGFTFDDKHKEGDSGVEKNGVQLVVDPIILNFHQTQT
jgi:iron-sulfur cluster insertion protein